MGQAKIRGSFEERRAVAVKQQALEKAAEEERQARIRAAEEEAERLRLEKMTPEEREAEIERLRHTSGNKRLLIAAMAAMASLSNFKIPF